MGRFLFLIILLFSFFLTLHATANDNSANNGTQKSVSWTNQELEIIKQFSFQKIPHLSSDPSNKFLYKTEAIKLGKSLFHEIRLSKNKKISCSSCHIKAYAFTDTKKVATGMRSGMRNTPTLLNVAEQNWFFWDGRKDSLWAQALGPIENPAEHDFTRVEILHFIVNDEGYRKRYEQAFNHILPSNDTLKTYPEKAGPNSNIDELIAWKKLSRNQKKIVNRVFSNIGKAIAAYVSTIKNKPTRFDRFVDDLVSEGQSELLKQSEQNGLKLFINKRAGCFNCHSGALFSNKLFHNVGTGIRAVDNGRSEIIDEVIRDEFNCLGKYSDAKADECMELKYANTDKHVLAGSYKTPSLRNLSKTAPYMHDGRFKSLTDVLAYYASIDKTKAQEIDLPTVNLSVKDQADIVSFLLTL